MKKVIVTLVTMITLTAASAHTGNKDPRILNKFKSEFREAANIQFTAKADHFKISFMENGKNLQAYYDLTGEFLGTSQVIDITELPTYAKRTFARKFAGYTVKEVVQYEGTNDTAYFISAQKNNATVILKVDRFGAVTHFGK